MTSWTAGSAVLYWSESTPIASSPAGLGGGLEHAATGAAGGVVDDVGAVVVHALRRPSCPWPGR